MAITSDGRGGPWKLLRLDVRGKCRRNCHDSFRGNCGGNCRGLPWIFMVVTTELTKDRTAARAVATTVAFAVERP